MKAPDFEYLRAASLEDALGQLAQRGDSAQVLAGGQSLLPMLNLRVAAPACLIDIGGLAELREIRRDDALVHVGALVTHRQLLDSPVIADALPLLAQAVPHVAHPAIRNAGTIGGSLALADPAAEYPAVALALEATLVLQSTEGVRRVAAADFFQGFYQTARQPHELLVGIELAIQPADERSHFDELARRRGDYAMVGLAGRLAIERQAVARARLVFFAVGERPILAARAMAALAGRDLDAQAIGAAQAALEHDLAPRDDLHADRATRMHLARVLLGRALQRLGHGP